MEEIKVRRDYSHNPSDKLKGKYVLMLCAHEFEDTEVLYPILRLSEEGAKVTIGILEKGFHARPWWRDKPITGRWGTTVPIVVMAEGVRYEIIEITRAKPGDYDALVIPGGFAPDFLRCDRTTLKLVADMHNMGKIISAICHGPQVLISSDVVLGTDIIRGRNVTCFDAVRDDIQNAGGKFEPLPARRDGNVITGRIPDALPQFVQAIVDALTE